MSRVPRGILAALAAWALFASAASAQELLEPDKAFRFSARALDPSTLEITYRIAPGYYLYRKNFKFELKKPAGAALAAHPNRAGVLAAATESGVHVSENHGDNFAAAATGPQATSVAFDLDGAHLWFGGYENAATLTRIALKTRNAEPIPIPAMTKDAVAYIAQNPANPKQVAIATFTRDVYLSNDAGKTWKQIAAHGETR